TALARRGTARDRLPRGPEGKPQALLAALPAAPGRAARPFTHSAQGPRRGCGRAGFVRTAMKAGVPIVPIAVVGAEEAMPIFAHVPLLQRLTGLIYFPINHAFPQFGLAAAMMYMPPH